MTSLDNGNQSWFYHVSGWCLDSFFLFFKDSRDYLFNRFSHETCDNASRSDLSRIDDSIINYLLHLSQYATVSLMRPALCFLLGTNLSDFQFRAIHLHAKRLRCSQNIKALWLTNASSWLLWQVALSMGAPSDMKCNWSYYAYAAARGGF